MPKKYAIKPPWDLTSRFEQEQEDKRLQEIKNMEEKQRREEEERLLVGINSTAPWHNFTVPTPPSPKGITHQSHTAFSYDSPKLSLPVEHIAFLWRKISPRIQSLRRMNHRSGRPSHFTG